MPQQDCATMLQPLSVSELTAVSNLPTLNYTNQDFFSMKTRLISFIQQKFPNDFQDFVESDLGIMLIENWAFLADTLSFKMDQIVNELFIDTVTEIENAFRLANLVGFKPTPPIGSTAMVSATIPSVLATDLVISSGLSIPIVSGGTTVNFELFAADALNNPIFGQDIVITAGNLTNTSIVAIQGQTLAQNFQSTGENNQTLTLTSSPVLFSSVQVSVDGSMWTAVDYFSAGTPNNEYIVSFTSSYQAFVMFGNGQGGRVPSSGSQIQVTYRIGGGTIGNVLAGSINESRGTSVPGFGFQVPVSFFNYTAGQNGYGGDQVEDIRNELPQYVKTQGRAVTGEDYKILSGQFVSPYNGQIGKSLAVLRNSGCAGNIVDLYVLALQGANGLQTANDQLKEELSVYMNGLKMATDYLCIRDGVVVSVDVVLDIVVDSFFQKFQQQIQTQITNAVNSFFSLNNWDYGQSLKDSQLIKSLSGISEITDIQASFITDDPNNSGSMVTAQYFEVIRNDTTTINFIFD